MNTPKKPKTAPQNMHDAVKTALDKTATQKKHKYDGVLGMPPYWLPDPLKEEFLATRNYLLDANFSPKEIKKCMETREKESLGKGFTFKPYFPHDIERDIDALIYIQKIVHLGKKKGIDAYLGESGIKMYRPIVEANKQKEISKLPRQDALQKLIVKIVSDNPDLNTAQVLDKLKLHERGPVIEYINEEDNSIEWSTPNAHLKTAPITGLRYRILRAKKFLNVR